MRPKQWLKNGLLFFGLVYARELTDPESVLRALIGFAAFCCISSAGYIFNDLRDLELDRLHPTKRYRPIAAGVVSRPLAGALALVLLLLAAGLAISLGTAFVGTCIAYVIITASYSLWWKHVVLLDVFGISAGFVVRVVAGAVAVDVPISPWLYVCTILGSLVIALGKRRSELGDEAYEVLAHRPALEHYTVAFLDQLITITATASVMAYSLYTFSAENVPRNQVMMVTIPVVLYGVFRYLFLVQVRGLGGSPEELLLRDRSLAVCVILFLALSAAILYLAPR
jgi:4-hydroxybenzoate polyprenyltransferase